MFFEKIKRFGGSRLVPGALIGGVVFSFLGCCAFGRIVGARNPYTSFVRFHQYISAETLYCPTARQVRFLARAQLDPNKIVVVVGGSSVMHGTGQREQEVWTKSLQSQLGDDYQVINLALRCGSCFEFGGVAAEMLSREYPKLIYLADFKLSVEPDGDQYRYFYWDAHYKGLLRTGEARMEWERGLDEERRSDGAFVELRRQMKLDSGLSFRDLWTQFEYRFATTVWMPTLPRNFRSRRTRSDPDLGPAYPFESRHPPERTAGLMCALRQWNSMARVPLLQDDLSFYKTLRDLCAARKGDIHAFAEISFPEPFRGRTLLLVSHYSPYYVNQLLPAERTEHRAALSNIVASLQKCGFDSMPIGEDYAVSDYQDFCHLSEAGGRRMAGEVAPKVRALAARLGFTHRQAAGN